MREEPSQYLVVTCEQAGIGFGPHLLRLVTPHTIQKQRDSLIYEVPSSNAQ
jgi:hypothetical protein